MSKWITAEGTFSSFDGTGLIYRSWKQTVAAKRALHALGQAMRTRNGRVYLREELEGLFTSAGFTVPCFSPLDVPPHTMGMILARKGESSC
jgi:hypothetical protein